MLIQELRHAVRTFHREPRFAAGVMLNFALAIGSVTAMFGLANRLLFAPPPGISDPDRLARVGIVVDRENGGDPFTFFTTSYPAFQAVASVAEGVERAAAFRPDSVTTGRGADGEPVSLVAATGSFFSTLGVRTPAAGRLFGEGDDALPAGNDVVVLGHAFWQRRFSGDRGVIGTELVVDGQPLTVVGVAPRGFQGVGLSATDLFVPLSTAMRRQTGWSTNTGMNVVNIVARLRDDGNRTVSAERMAAAVREATARYDGGQLSIALASLEGAQGGAQARIVLYSLGVCLAVLLIATANAGTLLLLRATRKRGETAVRVAMGAGTGALARQSLLESMTLALGGAIVGVLLSRWMSDVLRLTLMPGLAREEGLIDPRVLAVAVTAALAAGAVAGLSPLVQWRRRNISVDLRSGGAHGTSGRFGAQRLLVGFQVSLCTVLLVGAGLFSQSMRRVQAQDLGFSTARLLYVTLDFHGALRGSEQDRAYLEAVERVRTVPGVRSATVAQGMPFASHHIPPVNIPGYELPPPDVQQLPILYAATPDYLAMMDVTLREGRLFTSRDVRGAPLVVLVNETMAKTVWPGQQAIGRCLRAGMGDPSLGDPMAAAAFLPCREVVGVVRDSRARSLRTEGNEDRLMQYYVPFEQVPTMPFSNAPAVHSLLVSVEGDPARLVAAVRRTIQGSSPVPVYANVRPYQDLLDPQLRSWRLGARLFSMAGVLALAIAAVGLFAVVSYLVSQRTQEIGVRLALGASGRGVARLVVRDALRMAGVGAVAGLVVALAGAPLLDSLLFQTSPRDPATLLVACGLVVAVAVLAALLPARRASRVSPMTALRS